MDKLKKSVQQFEVEDFKYTNNAIRYLPIGPDTPQNQGLDWLLVYKNIYQNLFGLKCQYTDREALFAQVLEDIKNKRNTRDLYDLIKQVYIKNITKSEISPYENLVYEPPRTLARTKTMVDVFNTMLNGFKAVDIDFGGNNFLEEIINLSTRDQCIEYSSEVSNASYLPFLANKLKEDFTFLSDHPEYLNENFEAVIEIYAFLYLVQLSLHLHLPNSRFSEPCSQEVYFILEGEKASKERYFTYSKGFKRILDKKHGIALDVFPHLGYLELISSSPLWLLNQASHDSSHIDDINHLNKLICDKFDITFTGERLAFREAINDGLSYHKQLFLMTSKTSTRVGANEKIRDSFADNFAKNFRVNKGRAGGWYFQLNTKTVLLLTNLIIGSNEKLLIDEVVEGFNQRGIYFDLKSKQALLAIYENIGNVIKLSDSGDAVYVTNTI
ncbi:DNA phosphorothioation-dependent restriction protein DptG [Pseudoalteromonas distincta]|uniref:DNA phosphorothioation-dependent restriction protein DptG n=1 Tax=Pseudoalteromonas distincta TaxID=77608 RepID=UPI003218D77C